MYDMLAQLLGVSFDTLEVSPDIIYLSVYFFVVFVTAEVFNIMRSVFAYFFDGKR